MILISSAYLEIDRKETMTKTDQELINIADTIKKQIPTVVLMSCGANKFGYLKESEEKGCLGGLTFLVQNCSKVKKARVYIQLMYSDTYEVHVVGTDVDKKEYNPIVKDVYCDMLGQTLDDLLETKEQTKNWNTPKVEIITIKK